MGIGRLGGSGGGAGLALGPATHTFGAITTTVAARTLRDTYATANPDWLGQYDANGSLMIRLLHTGTPGATFQVRADGEWVGITAAIEGPSGTDGTDGTDGASGGGINWLAPSSVTTADLTNATSAATAVDLGYDVDTSDDFFVGVQFESSSDTEEDSGAITFIDASRLSTANSVRTPLGQNDTLFLGIDADDNLLGWRTGGNAGTYRIRIWELGSLGNSSGVTAAEFSADGTTLTIMRSEGTDIVVSIPEFLRDGGGGTSGIIVAIGWSADTTAEASELTATSETESVVIPDHTENDYLVLWTADSAGTLSGIFTGSSFANGLNTYGDPVALELNGVAGMVRVTLNKRTAAFTEGLTVRVEFTQ